MNEIYFLRIKLGNNTCQEVFRICTDVHLTGFNIENSFMQQHVAKYPMYHLYIAFTKRSVCKENTSIVGGTFYSMPQELFILTILYHGKENT